MIKDSIHLNPVSIKIQLSWMVMLFIIAFSASAGKSLKVYKHIDDNGIIHYSSKKPNVKGFTLLNIKCPECGWKNSLDWHTTPLVKDKFEDEIISAANKFSLKKELIQAVIHAESSFIADNKSSAGAQGLMQLMPGTQKTYDVTNPNDPGQNINAGSKYLKHLLDKYKDNLNLALAAYNAGETAVAKYGNSVPPYNETKNYIKRVNILMNRYKD
jgi:soluble lytic murein transglycosylase-like protein